DGGSPGELRERLAELVAFVPAVSYGQLADLAATLANELRDLPYRAAAVVTSPEDAERRLRALLEAGDARPATLFGTARPGGPRWSAPTAGRSWGPGTGRPGSATCSRGRAPGGAPAAGRCAGGSPRWRRSTPGPRCRPAGTWWPPRWPSRGSPPARWPGCGR